MIMDMEAGVEHLGRGTASGVDTMIVVVEPGQRSVETAHRVVRMAQELHMKNIQFVANKITGEEDEMFIRRAFPDDRLLGMIPYAEEIRLADRTGRSVLEGLSREMLTHFASILERLEH